MAPAFAPASARSHAAFLPSAASCRSIGRACFLKILQHGDGRNQRLLCQSGTYLKGAPHRDLSDATLGSAAALGVHRWHDAKERSTLRPNAADNVRCVQRPYTFARIFFSLRHHSTTPSHVWKDAPVFVSIYLPFVTFGQPNYDWCVAMSSLK